MSDSQKQSEPLVQFVDTPPLAPIEVPCIRWQQAGYDVYSGICPKCLPGASLVAMGNALKTEGHGHVHLNGQGCVICKCGAYLKLVLLE